MWSAFFPPASFLRDYMSQVRLGATLLIVSVETQIKLNKIVLPLQLLNSNNRAAIIFLMYLFYDSRFLIENENVEIIYFYLKSKIVYYDYT